MSGFSDGLLKRYDMKGLREREREKLIDNERKAINKQTGRLMQK